MPVAKYFVLIGSALSALLLIVSWYFPAPPAIFADRPEIIATAAIRIKSERKWPERIQFDTSQPTIVPPAGEALPVVARPAGKPSLEALAQLNPDARLTAIPHRALKMKRRLARTGRSNRVAEAPVANRFARQDAAGWANNWQAGPNAMSRKSAASSGAIGWLAFSQR